MLKESGGGWMGAGRGERGLEDGWKVLEEDGGGDKNNEDEM